MCIRDRLPALRRLPQLDAVAFRIHHPAELSEFRFLDVLVAVSYTHLRAHETVLDIVCRLLLEKKKTLTLNLHLCRVINTNTN